MITFFKYNSCGNDFIIIDNRDQSFSVNNNYIKKLCDRNFGIGADGLILLENSSESNYFMNYFNSDGFISSFCGNGNLCCAHFASYLGIFDHNTKSSAGTFSTREGVFNLYLNDKKITISMPDIINYSIQKTHDMHDIVIDTGSPHYVVFKDSIDSIDINKEASIIRNSKLYLEKGINVNFVHSHALTSNVFKLHESSKLDLRTYERGVEAETLSCGTGVVAAAISEFIYYILSLKSVSGPNSLSHSTNVNTLGGVLNVKFHCSYINQNNVFTFNFSSILLSNTVEMVFKGQLPF